MLVFHPSGECPAEELHGAVASLNDRFLAVVAGQVGVHPVHFAATFRRFVGCSLGGFLRRRRFERARQRLADPSMTLAQNAADVGLADQSNFTRTFKRRSGMTPSGYRASLGFKTGR